MDSIPSITVHSVGIYDTKNIQSAIDSLSANGGGTIYLPDDQYNIGIAEPYYLTLKTNIVIEGKGSGIVALPKYVSVLKGTVLKATSGHPVFINDQAKSAKRFCVKNLSIDYSESTELVASSNPNDCAFKFTINTKIPYGLQIPDHFSLENIYIKNAYCAYDDTAHSWMSELKNIWSFRCRNGYRKANGTTFKFTNCWAHGSINSQYDQNGWNIQNTLACTLEACAMDQYVSNTCAIFRTNRGLVINGFDFEANQTVLNNGKIFLFDSNAGATVNGLVSYNNLINLTKDDEGFLILVRAQSGDNKNTTTFSGITVGGHNSDTIVGDGRNAVVLAIVDDNQFINITGSRLETFINPKASLTNKNIAIAGMSKNNSKIIVTASLIENADIAQGASIYGNVKTL